VPKSGKPDFGAPCSPGLGHGGHAEPAIGPDPLALPTLLIHFMERIRIQCDLDHIRRAHGPLRSARGHNWRIEFPPPRLPSGRCPQTWPAV